MSAFALTADLFIPTTRHVPRVIREGRLVSDNSMPLRDWSYYDSPAIDRKGVRLNVEPLPLFLQRQAG